MLASEVITNARLDPSDSGLVSQRGDRPAANELGHLTSSALARAQCREEGVRKAHSRKVHFVVVVGWGQPLKVKDLGLGTLAVHGLEDANRIDDVEVDDKGFKRFKAGQLPGLESIALTILVVHDDGPRVHVEKPLNESGSAPSTNKSTLVVDDRTVIEKTHLDCDGHWSSPVICGRQARPCAKL